MSTVGTFVANGHGQDYGNAAVQQTLYAVVFMFKSLGRITGATSTVHGDNCVDSEHFVANGQGYGSATVQHFVVEVAAVAHREWSPCASL